MTEVEVEAAEAKLEKAETIAAAEELLAAGGGAGDEEEEMDELLKVV